MTKKKPADVGLRQLLKLEQMKRPKRLALIAEGLPIILESARGLVLAARAIDNMPREADLLIGLANEEAAKILILMDVVRCPAKLAAQHVPRLLRSFYSHGARLIYGEACSWRPTDIKELRSYVDDNRKSHFVDGPTGGDFIFPNMELFRRESRFYADLMNDGDGRFSWNAPSSELFSFGFLKAMITPFKVAEALSHVGAFSLPGLKIVADVWQRQIFEDKEDAGQYEALIETMLKRLSQAKLESGDYENEHVQTLYRSWQMPMYTFDFQQIPVTLDELESQRQAYGDWEYGDY